MAQQHDYWPVPSSVEYILMAGLMVLIAWVSYSFIDQAEKESYHTMAVHAPSHHSPTGCSYHTRSTLSQSSLTPLQPASGVSVGC